jgi:fibronectin-binding autotransporter adhesin
MAAQSSFGATVTWVGATSNLWSVGTNWSTSTIPVNGDSLVFGAGGSAVALSDDRSVASLTIGGSGTEGLTFGLSAPGYTITKSASQTLTLSTTSAVGIKDLSLFNQIYNTPIAYSSDQTVQVGGTTGASLSQLTLSGAQTGGFRLTKTGNGTLFLSSNSNALGGLTVNAGVVSIGGDTQLSQTVTPSTNWIILDGGTLRSNITSLTINANRGITLGNSGVSGSGGTIVVSQGTTVGTNGTVYNGVIANAGTANTLTKSGVGILVLGGTNTYTGATRVNQGQLTLDFGATGAPTSNIISSSSALVLGGIPNLLGNTSAGSPILYTQGHNSTATTQTFNGTTIDIGNANVIARAGTGSVNTTINLGTLTHNVGGTVGFSTMTNGSTGVGVIKASNTAGILGGWATTAAAAGTGTAALAQTDWAAVDANGNIVAYSGYTTPTGAAPAIVSNSASNLKLDATSSGTSVLSAGTTELNTILVSDGTANRTITVGAGNTLRLGVSGGIWKSSTTNTAINISGGTLTAGGASTNTPGEIVLNSGAGAATFNSTISISSVIANNGSGAVSVVKTGTASSTLTGANTYTGGTYVNQGTLSVSNSTLTNVFGTGSVTISQGAQVSLTSNATKVTYANAFNIAGTALNMYGNTISGDITLLGDSQITSNATDGGAISGKISGDFGVSFTRGMHTLSNTGNDFSGNIGINGNSPTATSILLAAASGIKLGASEVLSNGAGKGNLVISASATVTGTLDMNGYNETINGLVSAGTSAGTAPLAIITNTNATAATLTLGDNNQTATYAGTIVNGTGTVAITKIGAGTQTFSGANTYTGATTISAGTLALGTNGTIAGTSGVNLGTTGSPGTFDLTLKTSGFTLNGQSLSGVGTVNIGSATLTINNGILAAGNSAGIVAVTGNLALTGATASAFELGTNTATSDQANVSGNLTYGGTLNVTFLGSITPGTYSLFDFAGQSGAFTSFSVVGTALTPVSTTGFSGTNIGGFDYSFSYASGDLSIVAAIPEPATYAALFGALALLGTAIRRRSKKSE